MGVPALFRWLSKKFYPVAEEEDTKIPGENGETITVPINMASANPNGMEFDNLYLDMNGIHPKGKPAPETEEEMMVEIFKLLFMAIGKLESRGEYDLDYNTPPGCRSYFVVYPTLLTSYFLLL
ncbi:hypothetical protein GALMADRAFT_154170 [Galerina marginata CBS 339.88]|uniref:Xrn1 N-terminal domain-containing protein n=1 Tax=Galerina marginata (strain CBS 339.88) TaxID=685588 RepID=A0A067TJP7_GALM3|nr:hypothetical protein GALMADRAFT_154170 [Galerina marginata CBS 339.88]